MIEIYADELQAGDVVEYGGQLHVLTQVDRGAGWSWPVAADGTGWAMALDHHVVTVLRQAA